MLCKGSLWLALLATQLLLGAITGESFATCTGSDPCNACKNCKYCKHCAKEGGTCGVCKRSASYPSNRVILIGHVKIADDLRLSGVGCEYLCGSVKRPVPAVEADRWDVCR